MSITSILLLICTAAIFLAVIGIAKKIKILKIASAFLFLAGIILMAIIAFALKNM